MKESVRFVHSKKISRGCVLVEWIRSSVSVLNPKMKDTWNEMKRRPFYSLVVKKHSFFTYVEHVINSDMKSVRFYPFRSKNDNTLLSTLSETT